MRLIKFRGIEVSTGETVYSQSIKFDGDFIWLRDEFYNWLEIKLESIVQLIGYDELGNEIYEGDEFADPFNGRVLTVKIGARVQEKDDDTPLQDFIDGFYVLKPIKIDVLFSVPDLSDKDFQVK